MSRQGFTDDRPADLSDDVPALMARAWAHFTDGDIAAADALFAQVLARQPRHRGACMGRVHAARARQDHAGALARIEAWLQAGQASGERPFSRMVLNGLELCILTGRAGAAPGLAQGLELEGSVLGDRELLRLVAAAERLGLPGLIGPAMARLGALDRISLPAALRLVQLAGGSGEADLVTRLHGALRARVPEADRAALVVAVEGQAGGPLAALAALRRLTGPRRTEAQAATLGETLVQAGQPRLALRYLRLCARRWPGAPRFRLPLLRALIGTGQPGAARASIDGWAAQDPEAAVEARVELATALGDLAAIEAGLDRMEPRRRIPQLRLQVCFARGDLEGAERLVPEVAASMGRGRQVLAHFGATHVGSVLGELRLWRRFGDGDREAGARAFYAPAREILDEQAGRLARLAAEPVGGMCPISGHVSQYWDTPEIPSQIGEIMGSWQGLPDLSYTLYDKRAAMDFLRDRFGADHLRAFRLANHAAEGADFLRLCLLLDRGGIYADADDRRIAPAAELRQALIGHGRGMVVYRERFGAIANNLIAARAGHPVLALAVEFALQSLLTRENDGPWSKTGPGLMTRAVACFVARADDATLRAELLIRPEIEMRRVVSPHIRLPYKSTPLYWDSRFGGPDGTLSQALRAAFLPDPASDFA